MLKLCGLPHDNGLRLAQVSEALQACRNALRNAWLVHHHRWCSHGLCIYSEGRIRGAVVRFLALQMYYSVRANSLYGLPSLNSSLDLA